MIAFHAHMESIASQEKTLQIVPWVTTVQKALNMLCNIHAQKDFTLIKLGAKFLESADHVDLDHTALKVHLLLLHALLANTMISRTLPLNV